jgi:hypothetical protein
MIHRIHQTNYEYNLEMILIIINNFLHYRPIIETSLKVSGFRNEGQLGR